MINSPEMASPRVSGQAQVARAGIVAANQADLAAKQEATELLKRAVIKQRLGREEEAPTAVSGAR